LHTSFFLQIDETASSGESSEIVYVNFKDLPQFALSGFDSDFVWDTTAEVEEQL
jgi:hypothetical protein